MPALIKSWFKAVFEPLGGQTVTVGKSNFSIGWVVIEVATGDPCQPKYDLLIKKPAMAKLEQTATPQQNLLVLVWIKKRLSCHVKIRKGRKFETYLP